MEGMKEIARAYYARASEEERNSVNQGFARIDVNGDARVSPLEFESLMNPGQSHQNIFKLYDINGDGSLDFDEFLVVYYINVKVNMLLGCSGCRGFLLGPFFSCLLCLGKGDDTFDLCCGCYTGGRVAHEHSRENLVDQYSLIKMLRSRATADAQKGPGLPDRPTTDADLQRNQGIKLQKEMEELREIAIAQHRAGSPEVQALAHRFFQSLDTNGDRRVDLAEFLAFTSREGHTRLNNPNFFRILDRNGNGTLDFWEVLMLYFILENGRPFCDSCGNLIPGMFFSCVECYKNGKDTFDLCLNCYKSMKCNHSHGGPPQFLDNCTLLLAAKVSLSGSR